MATSAGAVGSLTCPGCGSVVVGATTIGQPIYQCGSWGARATCRPAWDRIEEPNVLIPTAGDLAELGEILEAADDAIMGRATHRVMGPIAVVWSDDDERL